MFFFKKTLFFIFILCQGVGLSLYADLPVKTAVVQIERILSDTKASKHLHQSLEDLRVALQKKATQREDSLRAEQDNLSKIQKDLSEAAFEVKRAAYEKKVSNFRDDIRGYEEKFLQVREGGMAQIKEKVDDVLKLLASKKKIDLVLSNQAVMHHGDMVHDITADVIAELDQKMPQVKINDNVF